MKAQYKVKGEKDVRDFGFQAEIRTQLQGKGSVALAIVKSSLGSGSGPPVTSLWDRRLCGRLGLNLGS